ncbi:MAG TPA: hypothetical protein VFR47_30610 [Anaerolineales bacterium]|nr:hypothetical protein [Anaerolineales bacterium]
MEFPWTTIVWLGIAAFVYIFGIYEGRNKGYKKRKAEEEQERKEKPPAPPVTVKVDDPGLMRIKNENGYLTLDLDGVRADPSALTADQRKRLIEMLTVIRPWLEGRAAPAPATPLPARIQPEPAASSPIPSASRPASQPVPSQTAAARSAAGEKDERSAPPATGIVGQIDAILQTRLIGTPLEGRGIYLTNSPEGGVIVNVGLQKFNGIDEVTDPEIKAALRAAITEWENKYTPGL